MRLVVTPLLAALVLALGAAPALADEKKDKGKGKDPGNFDDLFGAPPPKNNLEEMKKATEGVGNKSSGTGLAPKEDETDPNAGVQLLKVFAAERINQDKKLGCTPGGRDKKKLVDWTFDEVPAKANVGFEVCLTLASKAGREMNMNVAIVDARNQRVAKASDVIDFRSRPKIDHVLEFPPPLFKNAGQHFYVVDLDGKEVGRLPLFMVNLEGAAAPAPAQGATPATGTPPPTEGKITDKEPDAP
ncbi:MAG: hypothetical protein HYS27_15315 [Deltaproteobacteria bacterium]|nr:hypothetical protein [Deltaproteobacteria bacterium]